MERSLVNLTTRKRVRELSGVNQAPNNTGRGEGKSDRVRLMGCGRKFQFHSVLNGKPLEGFKRYLIYMF